MKRKKKFKSREVKQIFPVLATQSKMALIHVIGKVKIVK